MASLKDTIVNGALRVIGTLFANKVQTNTVNAPTSSGGSTYGPGSSGQVLKSNGTNVYWATDSNTTTNVMAHETSGYSNTAAGTAAKAFSMTGYVLRSDCVTRVYYSTNNTAASPTININGTGAKSLYYLTANDTWSIADSTNKTFNSGTHLLYYNGTSYYDIPTNRLSGIIETETCAYLYGQAGYATKNVFLNGFKLLRGSQFRMYVATENTSATELNLRVNLGTAKPIKINNTASSTSVYTLSVGWYEVIYDGTYFRVNNSSELLGENAFNTNIIDNIIDDNNQGLRQINAFRARGTDSFAIGNGTNASGVCSFCGGNTGTTGKISSSGDYSFNFQYNDTSIDYKSDGDSSVVLGGRYNSTEKNATNSVVLGGHDIISSNANEVHTATLHDHCFLSDDNQDAIIIPYSISLNVSKLHQKAYIHIPDGYVATPIAGGNTGCGYLHCFCNGYQHQSYSGWSGNFSFSIKTWDFHYHVGRTDWSLPWNQTGWFKKQLTYINGGGYGYTFGSFYYPSPRSGFSNGYLGMVGDIEIEVTSVISDSIGIGETNALLFGSLYCVKNSKIPPVSQMIDYT